MPIVTIHILEGRDQQTRQDLIKNVTTAIIDTLGVPAESVRIIINEMPYENYGIAGLPVQEYRDQKSRQP